MMKNSIQYLFLLLIAVCTLPGCLILHDKVYFSDDNSGKREITADVKPALEYLTELYKEREGLGDPANNVKKKKKKKQERAFVDTLKTMIINGLTSDEELKELLAELNSIDGVSSGKYEFDDEEFVLRVSYSFEDIRALNAIHKKDRPLSEGLWIPPFDLWKGNTFLFKDEMIDEIERNYIESKAPSTFGNKTPVKSYTVTFHFSKDIRSVDGYNAKKIDDRTASATYSEQDIIIRNKPFSMSVELAK